MDNFIRLYALYRSVPRWRVVTMIYRHAPSRWKWGLWIGKALFAILATAHFLFQSWVPYFAAMLGSACIWAWSFDRSRRSVFANLYCTYPDRIKYFQHNYQYIRYLQFREKMRGDCDPSARSVSDALSFLNEQIETDSHTPILSHPFISLLIVFFVTILGGTVGKWESEYIVATLLFLSVALYFTIIVLGALNTRQADLKEFKRFLLWAQSE